MALRRPLQLSPQQLCPATPQPPRQRFDAASSAALGRRWRPGRHPSPNCWRPCTPGLRQPTHKPRAPRNPPTGSPCSAPFIPCSYALPKRARYPPLGQGLLLHPARQTCLRRHLVPTHAVCPACVFSRLRRTQLAGCEHPCYQLIPIWYVTALSFVPPPLRSFPLFKLRGPILPHTHTHTHHAHHTTPTDAFHPACHTHYATTPPLSPAFPLSCGTFLPHATASACEDIVWPRAPTAFPARGHPFAILSLPGPSSAAA